MSERPVDFQMAAIRKMAVATYEVLAPPEASNIPNTRRYIVRKYEGDERGSIILGFQDADWARAALLALERRDRDIRMLLAEIDALEAERNRLQQAVNEAWDITSEPISSEVEMHPRITQIMDALQDALSKPTLDKYNVKLD